MRFSLRWLFAATAYIALVAAAFGTGKAWLVDVVWSVAIGFVVFTTAYLIGWQFSPNQVPVTLGFRAAGYVIGSNGDVYERDPANPGAYRTAVNAASAVGIANAVGTLAAGLIGCLVGRLAYRSIIELNCNQGSAGDEGKLRAE
jgi:hypothetical protein